MTPNFYPHRNWIILLLSWNGWQCNVKFTNFVWTLACKETRHLGILPYKMAIFYKGFWPLNVLLCPYPLDSKWRGFGGFKEGAVRLCSSKGCKVVLHQTLWKKPPNLTCCSFAAHWATETYCIFLETSKPPLFGAKRVRLKQDLESSKSLVGNMPKWLVSLQATVNNSSKIDGSKKFWI